MNSTQLAGLFTAMFDDAAMFPPADTRLPAAVREHARHRLSWYADMVGPIVCNARRLGELADQVDQLGLAPLDVSAVVPEGVMSAAPLVRSVARLPQLRVTSVEAPLKQARIADAVPELAALRADGITCYLELPVTAVSDRHVHELGEHDLRLKLRTGGTSIDAFRSEDELALPIVRCAAERLAFKCTAGLHNAVRHRDTTTKFEHHGFLNVALAARVAAGTGSVSATAAVLREKNPLAIAEQVSALRPGDVTAIRAMFCSFGTCSIDEPVTDLVTMGLVRSG